MSKYLLVLFSYVKEVCRKKRKNGSIYFRRMFDARLFKPKQTFNRVSPVLDFLFLRLHIIISFYVPTYICTSSVDVQFTFVNIAKDSEKTPLRTRIRWSRSTCAPPLIGDTAGSHIFWQHFRMKFEFS